MTVNETRLLLPGVHGQVNYEINLRVYKDVVKRKEQKKKKPLQNPNDRKYILGNRAKGAQSGGKTKQIKFIQYGRKLKSCQYIFYNL